MTRKLLPYEYDLIQQLGVTEDEYLDFIEVQFNYELSAAERIAKPQCEPVSTAFLMTSLGLATFAETLIVAAVLIAPGILFQVAAMLLMPKPSLPSSGGGNRAREQRFSPRFGFNSSQELGQYGDPINLVYCNTSHNPIGGVRIGTSLVWSSVESYGSTQFMQLLLVLGAASIKTLDFERTAFGQLPLGQFSESNTWLYYEDNGPVNFNNKLLGDGKDPTRDGAPGSEDVCRVMFAKSRRDGYSQAFSPSSLTSIGVYDPIPLNIEIQERRNSGKPQWGNLQITIAGGNYGTGGNVSYAVGNEITVVFAKAAKRQQIVVKEAAKDMRYQLAESLDRASTYMLGTAKFRLVSVNGGDENNLDDNDVRAKFECIEAGRRPVTEYDRTRTKIWDEDDREKLQDARDILNDPLTDAEETAIDRLKQSSPNTYTRLSPTIFVDDYRFTVAAGRTVSSPFNRDNTSGQVDQISGAKFNVNIKAFGFPQNYNFTDDRVVKWTNELDKKQTLTIPSGGSIAVSKKILRSFLANKPKLDVAALRDEIEDDLEKIRQLKDDVDAGAYDRNLRREAKRAISAINKRIDELEDKIDNKVRDASNLNKKTTTISGQKVLKDNTNLDKRNTGIGRLQNEIKRLQDDKQDILSDNVSRLRSRYTKSLRYANSPFTGFDGNRYGSGGIRAMKRRLAQLKGQTTTDQVGVKEVRDKLNELIKEKEDAKNDLKLLLKDWEDFIADADDDFFTKCLVKVESAAYQTVTACDFVKFAIRCKLFRRISGRAKDYGDSEAPDGYRLSDNGIHGRMAFFKVSYKETGASTYQGFPVVFAVRRGTDQDNFIGLAFKGPSRKKWEFKFDPIGDISAETRSGETHIAFIENEGRVRTFEDGKGATFGWTGALKAIPGAGIHGVLKERGPLYTNEWDLFSNRSDTQVQFSFDGGPEFRITSVTEQQAESIAGKYANLSMMALGVFSGRGVQDLRSITAYVTQGKSSWIVNETTGARTYSADSTSFAPDIFADTILDTENGIGKFAKSEGIDWNGVAAAKRFCKNNGLGCQLFMDGVIAEQTPWRQFWAETAPFSLLEFARVGGRETLIPAVPVNAAGQANREVLVNALFTAGNVLEGSYKEEFIDYGSAVQDLIATVIYRETESQDVFPRNSSVTVSLKGVNPSIAVSQSFDISQFVTQRAQAILFAKLLCNQRRHIRRGIEFKTFPTDTPISPGAYIYVDIGLNTWERVSSGLIMQGGELNAPLLQGIPNGSYSVLAYKGNTSPVSLAGIAVSNGVAAALAPYAGYMFVLGATTNRKRVFRVTEVQMDEEGEVTIKAMEHPCEDSGGKLLSRIANFSDSLFDVR
jgi:transcription elongation GreA/GreB family factor